MNPGSKTLSRRPRLSVPEIGLFGGQSRQVETARPETLGDIRTLPKGVIVLSKMRQYTPDGYGITIEAPYEDIKKLCDKHGVPIVKLEGESITPEQLSQGVVKVLTAGE